MSFILNAALTCSKGLTFWRAIGTHNSSNGFVPAWYSIQRKPKFNFHFISFYFHYELKNEQALVDDEWGGGELHIFWDMEDPWICWWVLHFPLQRCLLETRNVRVVSCAPNTIMGVLPVSQKYETLPRPSSQPAIMDTRGFNQITTIVDL